MTIILGNLFVLGALALLFQYQAVDTAIPITIAFGICYFFIARSLKKTYYLYPGGILFSGGYYLLLTQLSNTGFYHILAIPLVALLFGLGIYFHKKEQGFTTPFYIIAHMNVIFFTVLLFIHSTTISDLLAVGSSLLYAVIYFFLTRLNKQSNYLFGAAGFISSAYYFILKMLPFISTENHLTYFAVFGLVLTVVGYVLQIRKDVATAVPIYGVAVAIPIITSGVALYQFLSGPARIILVIGAVIYAFMIVLFKKEVFIYLITLTFGMLLFSFLQASQSKFTQHLIIYFLYLLVFLGVFFLIPYLRRIWKDKRPPLILTIANWKGVFLLSIPVSGIVLVFLVLYSLKASEHPAFCSSCHNMEEYYFAWEHSAHKDVKCVLCHYEPGLEAKVKGKIAGAIQLGQYFTNNYSDRPHAEVSNTSCMRVGCHREMDFKREIIYKEEIKFSHDSHMDQLVEEGQLKCTLCHGHVVKEGHFTVEDNACFICHFKGIGEEQEDMGDCEVCHGPPQEIVDNNGVDFNHAEFLADNDQVDCIHCHTSVTGGDGSVLEKNCLFCHDEESEMDIDVDPEIVHEIHLTEYRQECFDCHTEIDHGSNANVPAQGLDCTECHRNGHSVPEKMYRGTGGEGVDDIPDPMYLVNVVCDACHKYETASGVLGENGQHVKKARGEACDDCHGEEGYAEMAREWQEETRQSLKNLELLLRKARQHTLSLKGRMGVDKYKKAEMLIDRAYSNYHFVLADKSDGVHNYMYTTTLLDRVREDLEACMRIREDS